MNNKGEFLPSNTFRIERLVPGPIELVFNHFAKSELFSKWLMKCSIQPELGGLITLQVDPVPPGAHDNDDIEPHVCWIRGLISEFDPPHVLAFSWNESSYNAATHFKIELAERDGQVHLVLTHSYLNPEVMAAVAAGWHTHLESMIALVKGEEIPDFTATFERLLAEYRVILAGTSIVVVAAIATPAVASDLSGNAYKAVSTHRQELLMKYDSVWKDADHLQSDINILERANERDEKSIDIMYRDLKEKKDSLRKIELDIRDLDKVLS